MKCFYHPDREASATCKHCGKGLCQECAAVYRPCSCPECYQSAKEEALIDTNREFLVACLQGVIASAVIVAYMIFSNDSRHPFTVGEYILGAIIFFFFPYGWAFLTWFRARYIPLLIVPIWVIILFAVIKFVLSLMIGVPCFVFQLVRFLFRRHAVSQM